MDTPSKENEVVESASDNLFLEVKGDQYLSSGFLADNTDEHIRDMVNYSINRKKRTPLPVAGLNLIADLVKSGKDISTAGGYMKDFMFSIAAPILKSLSNDNNVHVLKGVNCRLIPQMGFGTHARGVKIMEAVEDGDFCGALDKMAAHRRKFQVDGLWKLQDKG